MSVIPRTQDLRDGPHRVLLVEDNPEDVEVVSRLLRRQGGLFELDQVDTLSGTCDRLLEERYDAVLLDLTLPDGDHLQTLRKIARFAELVPVVALTGLDDEALARACLETGIQDYLHKSDLNDIQLIRSLTHAITRHRAFELQQRLRSAGQQLSLGYVASGVVHELNNMATVVLSNIEHAEDCLRSLLPSQSEEDRRLLEDVLEICHENIATIAGMSSLAGQLKLFARQGESELEVADLDAVVSRTLRILSGRLRQRATVTTQLGNVPRVAATESKISQVLINLLLNAADALAHATAREIHVETTVGASGCILRVSDTGCGIPDEMLERIFDPFFSSKPVGKGTGLGLAICSELVAGWGGTLDVESRVGHGTTFILTFPFASPPAQASPALELEAAAAPHARARVLFVDDLDELRRSVRRMIEAEHDITDCASGAEALALIQSGTRFDAILCDLMMPNMTGMEFFQRVVELDESLRSRFAFLTGGVFDEYAQVLVEQSEVSTLSKPVTRRTLLRAIDAILNKQQASPRE